jgi:hypothetical protein
MMVEKVVVGRGRRREKKQESTRDDQTASMAERAVTSLSIYLGSTRARQSVAQEGTHNSIKRRVYFGTIDRR